jgi:hypothetical protein
MHRFFISHYSDDKRIAELFSNALRRITLEQIVPWFSSDDNPESGLKPGDIWFNQILAKIKESRAIVAILTPNSCNRPWIYFESGIGQALDSCEIIPVCIGISRDSILPPLGLFQCYQLNDHRSVVEFFAKLLALFKIKFDEEMSRVVVDGLVLDLSKVFLESSHAVKAEPKVEDMIESLRGHIDKRFLELIEKHSYGASREKTHSSSRADSNEMKPSLDPSYSVSFTIDFPSLRSGYLFIDIRPEDTFQNVTDTLYFLISDHVKPYTYLENWIIVEEETDTHIVIREIGARIPAKNIFRPNTKWRIVKLKKPYSASDSSKRVHGNI